MSRSITIREPRKAPLSPKGTAAASTASSLEADLNTAMAKAGAWLTVQRDEPTYLLADGQEISQKQALETVSALSGKRYRHADNKNDLSDTIRLTAADPIKATSCAKRVDNLNQRVSNWFARAKVSLGFCALSGIGNAATGITTFNSLAYSLAAGAAGCVAAGIACTVDVEIARSMAHTNLKKCAYKP